MASTTLPTSGRLRAASFGAVAPEVYSEKGARVALRRRGSTSATSRLQQVMQKMPTSHRVKRQATRKAAGDADLTLCPCRCRGLKWDGRIPISHSYAGNGLRCEIKDGDSRRTLLLDFQVNPDGGSLIVENSEISYRESPNLMHSGRCLRRSVSPSRIASITFPTVSSSSFLRHTVLAPLPKGRPLPSTGTGIRTL